ncbi:hypothetical protein LOY55_06575 [Pseudomonas sp. B21-040]|uniref:hypothetical protein n=1 Tax=Pseudomonas sp. B21-040 TaxID=2895486 RepID=UPI00215E097C|nr:hypothetical protein [Pseudomonas sp. B21-040]UVL41765.1 hypothetical protein LOY55_06575 [Pseudomonas sp. B21-040]
MTNKTEERITIQGVPPQYDEKELLRHQAERHTEYHSSRESYTHVFGELPFDFINNVIELANQGYELSNKLPITLAPLSNHAFMRKPENVRAVDLEAIDIQVKQSYVTWLESEHEDYRQRLKAQLIQTAEIKEAKRIADKEAKMIADIERQVADTFTPLVIPA